MEWENENPRDTFAGSVDAAGGRVFSPKGSDFVESLRVSLNFMVSLTRALYEQLAHL